MDAMQKLQPYRGRTQRRQKEEDVITKAIYRQDKKLNAVKRKNRILKEKCADQKARRKQAERRLDQERTEAAQRERHIRLQTKLDDYAFYRGSIREEEIR